MVERRKKKKDMNFNTEILYLGISPSIRLRPEFFGGLIFDTSNGNLFEVDKDGFKLLSMLQRQNIRYNDLQNLEFKKKSLQDIDSFVAEMLTLKIVTKQEKEENLHLSYEIPQQEFRYAHLVAPETIHWAITYRCNKNCPDCYVNRHCKSVEEMNTEDAMKLIEKITDWNVFQLAIGGGEPLEREDLPEIIEYAHQKGLMVHVTTGRTQINPDLLKRFSSSLTSLQLGLDTDFLLTNSETYFQKISESRINAEAAGLRTGVNLILDTKSMEQLDRIINKITDCGFKRIVLLRYKPPQSIERWKERKPRMEQLVNLQWQIAEIKNKYPDVSFRFDCAFSFIQRNLTEKDAIKHGFKGCVAADRILSVTPDGSVYPCSQLVHERFCGGNLLEENPEVIWNHSKKLKKYRNFRKKNDFAKSSCGICLAKKICGGCRVFAEDGFGEDPGCPEPLHRPLEELGKIGRQVDLSVFLEDYQTISVGDYMERYGIGQKTAMKELRNSQIAYLVTGKGKNKSDIYQSISENTVMEIQESIGYTNWGYPYATYDEIAEWIGENNNDYPRWLNNNEWSKYDEINID